MKLSIIIPSKNEETYIRETLKSIQNSNIPFDHEIILSDCSTDFTRNIAKDQNPDIHIIEGGPVGTARNNGAKIAKGEILLFIDADITISDKELINSAVRTINKGFDMVTTKLSCRNDIIANNIYKICNLIQRFSVIEGKPFSTGCFMMIKRDKFMELGGFNEKIHFAEDYHLSRNISPTKFKILNSYVRTDNRRFIKTGYFGLMKEFIRITIHRNKSDNEFFKDINYWD
jgi:glycosyltransferase involved in cell wall biosynthesis